MSCMSIVWEYTNGCAKIYICALYIYLMTVLSSLYDIIMERAVNAPVHGNNFVDRLSTT